MAIFAGNFVCKASFGLQCRALLIPWMKKSSSIGCSSGRANSSSFPVKYIPKKTLKKEKPEISKKTLKTEKSQTEKPQTSSTSKKAPENKVIKNGSDHNALRFEVHNDGKSLQRSFVLDKNSQNQNQNQMPIHYLTYHANQELKEETDYDEGVVDCESIEEPKEVVEELEIHWEKNPHYQEALQGVKTNKQDAEKMAIELLATRLVYHFENGFIVFPRAAHPLSRPQRVNKRENWCGGTGNSTKRPGVCSVELSDAVGGAKNGRAV
ncbi:hypothetical protein TEA_002658 [Camellia sinensis var. sinensis]|uniref:Uncharacterized protein n=1 Tax=Camellia sinensis var. sinensis TaxID=542762 RepID=A0A4S4F0Q6_CAMSN|nr:hypothetical protein TEA_002658 [Camellia sinensis var. sinensis]